MKKLPLKYRLNVIGGGLIIFIVIRTYLPALAAGMGLRENFDVWLLVYTATLALSCLVPIAFIENMCGFHPILFEKKKVEVSHFAMIMEAMLIFTLLAMVNSILLMGLEKVGISFPPQQLEPVGNTVTFVLYFSFSAIIPAIFEELFLRGIVLNLLLPNGRKFAVIVSALIFTLMHTQVQSFISVFGAGVVLACIYLHTGSIYTAMALHFVNNAYSFLMMYMQQRVNGISSTGFAAFVMAFILVGGVMSTVWLNKHDVDIFIPLKDKGKNSGLSKLISSPVMVLGLICCLMAVFSQLYTDLAI